jgi:outer membrane biogenesis lipoprotein LolB
MGFSAFTFRGIELGLYKFLGKSLVLIVLSHCSTSPVLLTPVPPQIESMEGYASLRYEGAQGSARTKFSFLFISPDRGRIDASDFLGRAIYQIIITDNQAYFILPSKKVYCQAEEQEIVFRFMGFHLNLEEMAFLLSGRWPENKEKNTLYEWKHERDNQGRIVQGNRGDLQFYVEEFITNTSIARSIFFTHPLNEGSLKIKNIGFNQPLNERAFSSGFLQRYEEKTWEEIQKLF